jgi:chemotaxis protein methyltransferase CheR
VNWVVNDTVRSKIEFRAFNLLDPYTMIPPCDLVFMRNVLIYFDTNTKKAILEKVRRVLRPDGHLFLGGAETTMNLDNDYARLVHGETVTYRPRGSSTTLVLPGLRAGSSNDILPGKGEAK